jgi:hypothetical protein
MLSLPLPRLPARADVLAALHSDRYPPGHRIHVRARSGGQRRLADELPGELVNRMRQRQAEARTRELREQITPAACHSADLGDSGGLTVRFFQGEDTRIGYGRMLAPRRRMTTEEQEWRDRYDRIASEIERTAA